MNEFCNSVSITPAQTFLLRPLGFFPMRSFVAKLPMTLLNLLPSQWPRAVPAT
jgi:hypothetical protein